jgi:hypothetical protein
MCPMRCVGSTIQVQGQVNKTHAQQELAGACLVICMHITYNICSHETNGVEIHQQMSETTTQLHTQNAATTVAHKMQGATEQDWQNGSLETSCSDTPAAPSPLLAGDSHHRPHSCMSTHHDLDADKSPETFWTYQTGAWQ